MIPSLQCVRQFLGNPNTTRMSFTSSTKVMMASPAIVELREYTLQAEHAISYIQATKETVDLRKSYTPLRFFSLPETGGQLQVATHAYYYEGGHDERNERRAALGANADWKAYIVKCRPFVLLQSSNIFVEAPLVKEIRNVDGLSVVPDSQVGDDCILELRRYKLKLGYDTVPNFLDLYGKGLPSKLSADGTDPSTSLVTLLYSDVGRMNEVIEVWRHGNGTKAMEKSRAAARNQLAWKNAIAGIADLAIEFQTTIHKPLPFSPIK